MEETTLEALTIELKKPRTLIVIATFGHNMTALHDGKNLTEIAQRSL